MANNSTLTVRILGNASDAIREVGRLNGVLGTLGKGALLAGGALGAAGLAAGTALFAIGNEFNNIENTIIKGTGATGAALDSLLEQSKDVLATVPDSGQVVAGALADVNTFFGQTGDTLEESTRLFLDFARVTDADLTTAIGGLDAAFTQFGESPNNLNETLGDFTRISQATGAPVDRLIGQLETFGPLFANAGFSIEETTAIFGQLEQAGVDVTRVGPALNKFFRDTAAAGEDPRLALEGMVTAIADAETSADALNLATDAFGAEGAQRLSNAIRSGNFDLEDFNGLLGEGTGLVGEQAEATQSFGDKLNLLKNQVFVALAPAAEALFEAIGTAIDDLQPYIDQFGVWFAEQLPLWIANVQAFITKWAPIVIGAFRTVVDFFVTNWPTIEAFLVGVFEAYVWYVENVLLPAAEFLIEEVFTPIFDWVQENWPQIEATIVDVLTFISEAFTTFTTVVSELWAVFGDEILEVISVAFGLIEPLITGAFDIITGTFNVFKGLITGDWSLLWNGLGAIFTGAWDIAKVLITGAFDVLAVAIGLVLDGIKSAITGTWDSIVTEVTGLGGRISTAAVGIFDGIKEAFKSAINFVIDGWNGLSFSVPSIPNPFGDDFGGQTISVSPQIPRLAAGGALFREQLFIGGDNPNSYRDPEIVAPQSFIRQAVDEALAEFAGSASGAQQPISITATGYNRPADLLEDSLEAIRHGDALAGRFSMAGDMEAS